MKRNARGLFTRYFRKTREAPGKIAQACYQLTTFIHLNEGWPLAHPEINLYIILLFMFSNNNYSAAYYLIFFIFAN
jgi:hypothetical protein